MPLFDVQWDEVVRQHAQKAPLFEPLFDVMDRVAERRRADQNPFRTFERPVRNARWPKYVSARPDLRALDDPAPFEQGVVMCKTVRVSWLDIARRKVDQ